MAQDADEQLGRFFGLLCVACHGFGDRLVHRFIEPDQVTHVVLVVLSAACKRPEPDDAGPQGTVLGDHRVDRKAGDHACVGVGLGRCLKLSLGLTAFTPGFFFLCGSGLGLLQIVGNRREDFTRVIAQGLLVQHGSVVHHRGGEVVPRGEDVFRVGSEKAGKSHD